MLFRSIKDAKRINLIIKELGKSQEGYKIKQNIQSKINKILYRNRILFYLFIKLFKPFGILNNKI